MRGEGSAIGTHGEGPTQGLMGQCAFCAESKGGHVRPAARCGLGSVRAWGGGDASGMHEEGPTQGCGGRARAERTQNISFIFVTLDVSKLSGWLNALASCRVDRRACDAGKTCGSKSVRALGSGNATGMHGEGPTQGCA